ncbi:NEDD4 family-interacting protein 1 isoform 2 [Scophthalmus maximus]|uniref:NEDD4 family-interacting protein 1 isoform 2 n=1 Tax=Scophthalmus maximus TaxID=52904 RepID=A0A2U9B813_SCOMX|nr:NEDD4 family-interacting protein 1-like isoform X5 [Scophthalmus maximus]AWO99965.1 NEDD4 family-interacting protein 1 isoform 2 [Scophthalmus maximus]
MAEPSARYQQLPDEDDPEESPQVAAEAPPPYSSIAADNAAYFDYKEDGAFPKPPSYNVATTLPSYDEAERTKAETTVPLDEDFVTRDDFEDTDQLRIGNDGIFMLTFFMAFLFNWIGFFLSFCLTTSAAGRYGAISGFGLSLIKWILIVRFSTYFPGYFDGQYWLWWVFLVLGFLLFLRGFINYARIRKMADTFSTLPHTRVLFIY